MSHFVANTTSHSWQLGDVRKLLARFRPEHCTIHQHLPFWPANDYRKPAQAESTKHRHRIMPPKNKKASNAPNALNAPKAPLAWCIRCPDAKSADSLKHANDFNKCQQDFETGPGKDKSANDLWWGFTGGPVPGNISIDLSNIDTCRKLLAYATGLGPAREFNLTDGEEEKWMAAATTANGNAVFQKNKVTKGMLEAAVRIVYPPTSNQKKKQKQDAIAKKEAEQDETEQSLASIAEKMKHATLSSGEGSSKTSHSAAMTSENSITVAGHPAASVPATTNLGGSAHVFTPAPPAPSSTPQVTTAPGAQSSGTTAPTAGAIPTPPTAASSASRMTQSAPTVPHGSTTASLPPSQSNAATVYSSPTINPANSRANPTALGLNGAASQQTNQAPVLQAVDQLSARLLSAQQDSDRHLQRAPRQPWTKQDMKNKHGLRTAFAAPNPNAWIQTNYPTMTYPTNVHVYEIQMVRHLNNNGDPINVKKKADKLLVLDHLVAAHYPNQLGQTRNFWVSDGELIWSPIPLFHQNNAQVVPPPLQQVADAVIQHENEIGRLLTLQEVTFTYRQTLNFNTHVSQLCYDPTAPSFNDSHTWHNYQRHESVLHKVCAHQSAQPCLHMRWSQQLF